MFHDPSMPSMIQDPQQWERAFRLKLLLDVDAAALGNLGLWHHYAEDAVLQGSLDSVLVDSGLEAEAALEPANTAL